MATSRNGHDLKDMYNPETNTLDIRSNGLYPSNVLSNLCSNSFRFDGMICGSMEGFLQALKYVCPKKQREICKLTGKTAKKSGDGKILWMLLHEAFWQGKRYDRLSPEFRELIFRAYRAMYEQNAAFRAAIEETREKRLIHSIGEPNPKKTILTEREFICMLYRLRGNK